MAEKQPMHLKNRVSEEMAEPEKIHAHSDGRCYLDPPGPLRSGVTMRRATCHSQVTLTSYQILIGHFLFAIIL
jgi:hypothetical protein